MLDLWSEAMYDDDPGDGAGDWWSRVFQLGALS